MPDLPLLAFRALFQLPAKHRLELVYGFRNSRVKDTGTPHKHFPYSHTTSNLGRLLGSIEKVSLVDMVADLENWDLHLYETFPSCWPSLGVLDPANTGLAFIQQTKELDKSTI